MPLFLWEIWLTSGFHLFSSGTKYKQFENTIKWTLRYTKIGILLILQLPLTGTECMCFENLVLSKFYCPFVKRPGHRNVRINCKPAMSFWIEEHKNRERCNSKLQGRKGYLWSQNASQCASCVTINEQESFSVEDQLPFWYMRPRWTGSCNGGPHVICNWPMRPGVYSTSQWWSQRLR